MFPELGFTGADVVAANEEGPVSQEELDINWADLDPSIPFNPLDKIRNLSAFFFDPITGGIIDVQQTSDNGQASAYGFLFHFLGFLILNGATLGFFTDKHIFRSQLDGAHLSLAGFIKKPPQTEAVPVYCESSIITWVQGNLSSRSTGGVFVTTNSQYTGGARTFILDFDDMQFQPWVLCNRTITSPPLQRVPLVKRPRIESIGEPGPCSSSTKKSKVLEAGEGGEPEAEESEGLEAEESGELEAGNLGRLSLNNLKASPFLSSVVLKAKVDYRCQCLLDSPYLQPVDKVALADKVFTSALEGKPWVTDNTPSRTRVLRLILAEHSTFRTNSVKQAERIVKDEFPLTGPSALDVQQVAGILRTLFIAEDNPNLPLSDIVDNCFNAVGQIPASGSGPAQVFAQIVVRPFAHDMIERLLVLLYTQRMKHSGNIPLRDKIKASLAGKPVSIVSVVYAISLIVDALINTFREKLAAATVSIPTIPSSTFGADANGLKFRFLLRLWERLEQSTEYGAQMLETRKIWGARIFV